MRKLLRTGVVPARAWGGQAVGIAPRERLKLRRQVAAAARKKESVSLSLFMEVENLDGRQAFGLEDGQESRRRHGGSRYWRYRHGGK